MCKPITGSGGDDDERLVQCHKAAAIVHSISFLVLVVLLLTGPSSSWAVTIPAYNGARNNWTSRYNLGWVLVSFPILSTANHLFYVCSTRYQEAVLGAHMNPVRWVEYSLSAGAMVWVIATLSGVTELRTLIALLVLNVALQYVGCVIEAAHAERYHFQIHSGGAISNSIPFKLTLVGWFVFMAMWIEIGVSFFCVIAYDTQQKPPDMVYAIVIVLFVLFASFGVLQLAYISGRIESFFAYEIGFIGLSLVSKTLLTWMVYGGVINAGTNMRP